jgi:hypothetical protein
MNEREMFIDFHQTFHSCTEIQRRNSNISNISLVDSLDSSAQTLQLYSLDNAAILSLNVANDDNANEEKRIRSFRQQR